MSKKLCIPVFSTVKGKLLFIWQNFLYNLSEKAKPIGGTGDNRFDISLDVLIKEDVKMVKTMDKERVLGSLKREKSVIDFFTGAGTGIVISCLFSADTMVRTVTIVLGVVMIGIGWYREAKYDKRLFRYMNNEER